MFIVQMFDNNKDLSKEMYILKAIRQGISTQENDVIPVTIQNYWVHNQVIDFGTRPLPVPDLQGESQP